MKPGSGLWPRFVVITSTSVLVGILFPGWAVMAFVTCIVAWAAVTFHDLSREMKESHARLEDAIRRYEDTFGPIQRPGDDRGR